MWWIITIVSVIFYTIHTLDKSQQYWLAQSRLNVGNKKNTGKASPFIPINKKILPILINYPVNCNVNSKNNNIKILEYRLQNSEYRQKLMLLGLWYFGKEKIWSMTHGDTDNHLLAGEVSTKMPWILNDMSSDNIDKHLSNIKGIENATISSNGSGVDTNNVNHLLNDISYIAPVDPHLYSFIQDQTVIDNNMVDQRDFHTPENSDLIVPNDVNVTPDTNYWPDLFHHHNI